MSASRSKIIYGQCRCCLAKGHHRDMTKEYLCNGMEEVCFNVFVECFNLFLSTESELTTLICKRCMLRLRDATNFRMMVVSSERQLLDSVSTAKDTLFINVPTEHISENNIVKTEIDDEELKEESGDDDGTRDGDDDGVGDEIDDGDDPDYVPNETSEAEDTLIYGEAELLARFSDNPPKLPTCRDLKVLCPEYAAHLKRLKGIPINGRNIMQVISNYDHNTGITKPQQIITEKSALILNVTTLLQNSNITPFKSKIRNGFPCFYCRCIFDDFDKLREHTLNHKKADIGKILKSTHGPESLIVYADISDLKCIICEKNLQTLNELKSHLVSAHSKEMFPEFTDRVIPFRMPNTGTYECQICGFLFVTFGSIERHMNVHFRNYVCKECGSGFATKYRLKVHAKSMHATESIPCEICGKVFVTHQKHKNHVNAVHKLVKRFKCPKCPERFAEYFRRQKHLVEVHGLAPLKYKCNVCDKEFDRKYTLSRHLKRDHLEERDYQCEICSYNCFTKNELNVHMVKHNGDRIFECSVCKKSYARKKTLKEHMRIHNNDRRFACGVCGQAFVQKCSLKGHLKTHHLEYNMQ